MVAKYDGTVAQMCMNLPFGDDLMCSATDLSEHHFTGQIYDQETKNDYFNARYYSNNTGRFLSPDPSGLVYADPTNPQSLNLYGYGLNAPLTNVDPTGLSCVTGDDGTQGDDGDGMGCEAAGILPSDQSAKDPNGNSTQFDPNKTQNVNVNPPIQGTDLLYDSQVATAQQWLQSRQQQPRPSSTAYLLAIQQTTSLLPNVCGIGVAGYFGGGKLGAGLSADTQNGIHFASGFNFIDAGGFKINYTIAGGANGNISYVVPTPFRVYGIPLGVEVGTNNGSLNSIQSLALSTNARGLRNGSLYINISNMGDHNCH